MDVGDTSIPGCYLLVVVGEPYSEDHKKQILQKISKGLLSWDVEAVGCDLSGLENVCSNVKSGKEPENELLIQHSNETLAVEVLSNPQVSTLKQCLKNLLLATTGHKHLIYAGYSFKGTGSWILQNGTFSFANFVEAFQDADVQKEMNSHVGCTIHVHCTQEGEWTPANVEKHAIQKLAKVTLNPPDKIDSLPGSSALIQCLESVLVTQTLEEMMTLSPLVGNIRFNRPTLYVFPGGEGDCALFGINGFNMLIDGGFNRKPCFWEFIRHLDRLDAVMVTRLCESNVCGITTLMKRKAINNIYPQIGYVFCNMAEGKSVPNDELTKEKDDLLVSVLTEGHSFLENLTELKMKPHRCLREATNVDSFTLYQKVGHGTLEMYTLSPQKDSKEVKEFLQQWASCKETFSRVKTGVNFQDHELSIPLSHAMSICSLVVWRPATPEDTITRIFFPGSAPQNRIFEGLEKLKNLDVLKQPVCSFSSLHPAEKSKPKSPPKGPLTKNNVTSSLMSNGVRRSSESLGSRKDAAESKTSIADKQPLKAPVKKDVTKSPPEPKKKEVKQSTTVIKKEVKDKKMVSSPKPTEVKKTAKPLETNKVTEPKSKGLKEVTNKKTVDAKAIKQKPEAPKPKPVPPPAAKTTSKTTKSSTQSPKHVPKVAESKKFAAPRSVKSTERKKENKLNEKKQELPKEEKLKDSDIKPPTETIVAVKQIEKEQLDKEKEIEVDELITDKNQLKSTDEIQVQKSEVADELSPVIARTEIKKETNEETTLAENASLANNEVNLADIGMQDSKSPLLEETVPKASIETAPLIEDSEKLADNSILDENASKNNIKLDTDFPAEQQQSATDLFLATASMEGSMHEGLIDNVQNFDRESCIQKEADDFLQHSYEKEIALVTEETIEEKSEKESLHDIMTLESIEDDEDNALLNREEKVLDSLISSKEYEKEQTPENADTTIEHEEIVQETAYGKYDNQYIAGDVNVAVHCDEVPVDNMEIIVGEKSPIVPDKRNLSVDIPSYSDDDDDIVKSPTPVAIVDYKDEEPLESYEDQNEKYIDDGPENEKPKDEGQKPSNDKHLDVLMMETEKPHHDEEKESSSLSEEEKDDDEEEMIRHPTPPGERDFYEKIGTSDMPTNVEELDTQFMEHYLPVTRQTPDSCHQPLYEEMEDEGESDSESPIVEQPVYSNVVQADYPEFVNISGGTTPSEPQSPKSVHDPKHRPPDASEALFKDTAPQESDEDRFEEEQKRTLTEETSQYITTQKNVQKSSADDYEIMDDVKEEQKHADSLLKDDDGLEQSMNEFTSKSYDVYGTQATAEESENILQSKEFASQDERSLKSKELLTEDSGYELPNQESDDNRYSGDGMMDNLPSKQESLCEYTQYSNNEEGIVSKDVDLVTKTEEDVLKNGIDSDLTKRTTVSDDLFGSHGMDQSFHESYVETEETNIPSTTGMDQSFHENYIETEANEQIISRMDQSFHESYIEGEETDVPIVRMDQSFHESYIEGEETDDPVVRMDQSFHESYIEGGKTDDPVVRMDQSFHESYIEGGETDDPVVRMDQSFHESYTRTETNEPIVSRMDQSFHEGLIETDDTKESELPDKGTYLEKENIEQVDVYSSHSLQQEENQCSGQIHDDFHFETKDNVQIVKDHSDIIEKEIEKIQSDDPKEKFNEYYSEEREKHYTEEVDDERVSDDAMGNHTREHKDGDYVTENYDREAKEDYYRDEREEDENYTTGEYHRKDKHYSEDTTEEGYYGDNERNQFADYDCTTQRTTYSYQSTVSAIDDNAISTERKELLYSTTNGVTLPRDVNGHETDIWEDKALSSYEKSESFQNHKDGYDKSTEDYYNEEQDLYSGMNIPDSAYAGSDFKTNDITQHHYMETASVDDILLERKEATIEKTSFSSVSCTYSHKDYQEHEDNVMLGEYSEHAAGLHDIQKESSTGFRLEDWSKPLGLPTPPESKTAVKSSTKFSSATKTAKLDKKPKITENGKSLVTKASPKTEKTKPKTNGASVPPVYVDLSYVPHHGDPNYCGVEFFQRIRARYYVFSGINPSKEVLNALLEAKKSWKDDSEVTIIPTYETDTLGYWMALNQESLIENKIDVAPSASRCTVNLQDHDTSCAAYRLEF